MSNGDGRLRRPTCWINLVEAEVVPVHATLNKPGGENVSNRPAAVFELENVLQ